MVPMLSVSTKASSVQGVCGASEIVDPNSIKCGENARRQVQRI